MKKQVFLVILLLAAFYSHSAADLMFEYEIAMTIQNKDQSKINIYHEKNYVSEDGLKIVDVEDKTSTIIRPDKEVIWSIDLDNNIYYEVAFDQISMMKSTTKDEMNKMGQSGKIEVKDTEIEENLYGYKCRKYLVYQDKKLISEVWATLDKPFDQEFMNLYSTLQSFTVSGFEELDKIEGFPIQTMNYTQFGDASAKSKTFLKSVSDSTLDKSEFSLPEGLIRIKAPAGNPLKQ